MWPIRLLAAAMIGAIAVAFLAPLVGYEEGVSRQAFGGQAALFPLIGLMWRAWDGLRFRVARRRALA